MGIKLSGEGDRDNMIKVIGDKVGYSRRCVSVGTPLNAWSVLILLHDVMCAPEL